MSETQQMNRMPYTYNYMRDVIRKNPYAIAEYYQITITIVLWMVQCVSLEYEDFLQRSVNMSKHQKKKSYKKCP